MSDTLNPSLLLRRVVRRPLLWAALKLIVLPPPVMLSLVPFSRVMLAMPQSCHYDEQPRLSRSYYHLLHSGQHRRVKSGIDNGLQR